MGDGEGFGEQRHDRNVSCQQEQIKNIRGHADVFIFLRLWRQEMFRQRV